MQTAPAEPLGGIQPNPRTEELFKEHRDRVCAGVDRLFAGLMLFQWFGALVLAWLVTPTAWAGSQYQMHTHVYAAIFLGGLITLVPVSLAFYRPGWVVTRHVVAAGQMLMSGLLIHLTGGRIETHFHVFGSLAFLVMYRDWRVFIPATLVVALDHLFRGLFFPFSVYGVFQSSPWRTLEHASWVIFEDFFLVYACMGAEREMWTQAAQRATLEQINADIEVTVQTRTAEAVASRAKLEKVVETLSQIIAQVQVAGSHLTGVSSTIGFTAKEQQASVAEQAAVATEILATSRQISATTRELALSMDDVARSADRTAGLAGEGNQALSSMQGSIKQMVDASGAIADKLAVLSEKANNIGGVVTTITRVADQTNLLSLNASIEAEKAGEYARGFGVVAGEIRRLADQTAVATLDIERIVAEMQSSVSVGVMAMDKFREEVRHSEGSVNRVVDQLRQIIGSVQSMTATFEQISEGMRSQSQGAEQISLSIGQLSESAQQNAMSVREFGGVIDKLQDATEQLHSTVSSYSRLELDELQNDSTKLRALQASIAS